MDLAILAFRAHTQAPQLALCTPRPAESQWSRLCRRIHQRSITRSTMASIHPPPRHTSDRLVPQCASIHEWIPARRPHRTFRNRLLPTRLGLAPSSVPWMGRRRSFLAASLLSSSLCPTHPQRSRLENFRAPAHASGRRYRLRKAP